MHLGGARQRALLAILLLHANEPVSLDRLIRELWETPPKTAAKMIRNNVWQLRGLLEEDTLLTRPLGYELRIDPDRLDAGRFERLLQEAASALGSGDVAAGAARLREALDLWRGPALADVAYEPFAQAEIARLEGLRLTATEDRIEADLALSRHPGLVDELEALAAEHPLRERLRAHLMLALYRSGRQAEALDVYQKTRRLLVEELGIEPSKTLQQLERAILLQDPSLDVGEREAAAESPRPPAPAPREVRKTVSVVFAEVTVLGPKRDPEALRRPMARSLDAVSRVLALHGGSVEKRLGGAVLGVFGIPVVHEDDPLRAVRAATELRDALDALNEELERDSDTRVALRAAVNTGDVVVCDTGAGQEVVAGDAIERAARLQQAAAPDEILAADSTVRLVESAVRVEPLAAGGDAETPAAQRLVAVIPDAPAIVRHPEAPMVGREQELAQLEQAFGRAVRERMPYLFTVLGPAGIGKSRLAAEFAASVEGEATVLSGRCLSYGEAITFWPLAEIVRQLIGDDGDARIADLVAGEDDAEVIADRVASAIGLVETPSPSEETFWGVRRLFEALARERPLVLVFDDVHWAEPTLLDLIEHVADYARDAPVLIVCLARAELLEERPSWGGGKLNASSLLLGPLSERESAQLIANLLGAAALRVEDLPPLAEVAEGNPLFLEQMLAMLRENGAATGAVAVPPTIQALLAARLDRLEPAERVVLERASVIGKEFWRAALSDLLPEAARASLGARLETLVRRELIRPHRSLFPGDEAFRFRHALLREAAYESVPKEARAELHERFAVWLEHGTRSRALEFEEMVAHHLEQAYRYHAELEPVDERVRDLARQAAERLARAGRRAYARGDLPAAVGLLSRAAGVLEPGADDRPELLVDLGEALRESGDLGRAESVLADAAESASTSSDAGLESHVHIARLRLQLQMDPELETDELLREANRAVHVFEQLGDERRLAKAWELLAWVPWFRCQAAAAEVALVRALVHAQRAADTRTEAQVLNLLVGAAWFGPSSVEDGIRRCQEILERPAQQRRITASALRALGGLRAMQGNFEEARSAMASCRSILEDLGLRVTAASAAETYGIVEMLAGDSGAAERELRAGYESLERMGGEMNVSPLAALLAQALHAQGRHEEALHFSELSEQAAHPDDLFAQVEWRAARGKVLARLGRMESAEGFAREAVTLAVASDFLVVHADALMDLGEILLLAGRTGEVASAVADALVLYERKGNVVSAERARALLRELAVRPTAARGGPPSA